MKAKTKRTVVITIELSQSEAEWLRAVAQTPAPNAKAEKFRRTLFDGLTAELSSANCLGQLKTAAQLATDAIQNMPDNSCL